MILNDDGSVRQLLRDGEPYDRAIRLEPAYAIVSTYFRLSASNIAGLAGAADDELRRFHGIQAFLMALTGVEAFTNVFFTLRARETGDDALKAIVDAKKGSLLARLERCVERAFAASLDDQEALIGRLRELFAMRAQIVHPRWDPASATIGGFIPLHIDGLSMNFQSSFEDERLCREAFLWCLLLVIRVAKAAGAGDVAAFCRFWTGQENVSEEAVLRQLGLGADDAPGG
ncbi:hypothetical protein [Sphingomonas sp. Leaf412]|uniref:hypothetical protein n=1 Tax=Sphingomonas sp. Leaf412 TaxID=1736370 RepID=UPI0012E3438D|nr:hypothetical protein [Sphingomonas sp. Leaf412]